MKTCFKCHESKSLNEFYRHPMMGDGHLGKCKMCTKRDVREREERLRLDPAWVVKERARHREKFHRLHHKWNHDKKAARRTVARWRKKNQHKVKAYATLSNAVRGGRIFKPTTCEHCKRKTLTRHLHGHHHDYTKPLDVKWLCIGCHGKEHRIAS